MAGWITFLGALALADDQREPAAKGIEFVDSDRLMSG
jgi:hypothetical protein